MVELYTVYFQKTRGIKSVTNWILQHIMSIGFWLLRLNYIIIIYIAIKKLKVFYILRYDLIILDKRLTRFS